MTGSAIGFHRNKGMSTSDTTNSADSLLVRGRILFHDIQKSIPREATAYIRLDDTSELDVPSKTIVQVIIKDFARLVNEGKPFLFTLHGTVPPENRSYSIDVLIDIDGDGRVSKGDFITMQNYSVKTFHPPTEMLIEVREVG
jgi:uncharacterized lipoprotein YbaY